MGLATTVSVVEVNCVVYLQCGSSVVVLGACRVYQVHFVYQSVLW